MSYCHVLTCSLPGNALPKAPRIKKLLYLISMTKKNPPVRMSKYQAIFESLKSDILSGRYKPGHRLPSEAALVIQSGASRITVIRAIRELQNVGLVDRRAGSGTYVQDLGRGRRPHVFGLLIPDLGETEIFEPMCRGIVNAPQATEHALLWGHVDPSLSKSIQARRLCDQFIAKRVSGVFFAPLEFEVDAERANRRILRTLREAGIPVVLLDRPVSKRAESDRPDLVGINNRQAGYVATEHLIQLGCRRIAFLGYHGAASTIEERVNGYTEALRDHGLRPAADVGYLETAPNQRPTWKGKRKVDSLDAFVCVNDRVAGQLMQTFLARHLRIPEDIRLVGIDDVSYASLLPVPLTTVRQPTREIGESALGIMLDRICMPHMQRRELLLDGALVVRRSCGAHLGD